MMRLGDSTFFGILSIFILASLVFQATQTGNPAISLKVAKVSSYQTQKAPASESKSNEAADIEFEEIESADLFLNLGSILIVAPEQVSRLSVDPHLLPLSSVASVLHRPPEFTLS